MLSMLVLLGAIVGCKGSKPMETKDCVSQLLYLAAALGTLRLRP